MNEMELGISLDKTKVADGLLMAAALCDRLSTASKAEQFRLKTTISETGIEGWNATTQELARVYAQLIQCFSVVSDFKDQKNKNTDPKKKPSKEQKTKKENKICKFWKMGTCKNDAQSCKFWHRDTVPGTNKPSSNETDFTHDANLAKGGGQRL